jgi:hypothetical protein
MADFSFPGSNRPLVSLQSALLAVWVACVGVSVIWEVVGSAAGENTAVGEEAAFIFAVRVVCLVAGMLWVCCDSLPFVDWETGGWVESNEQTERAQHKSKAPIEIIFRIK